MTKCATAATMTCGLDLGDKWSQVCLLDGSGEIVEETRVRTTEEAMRRFFARLDPARVVLEVGTHSPWVSRLVDEAGHESIVANPRRVKLISQNEHKTDRVDAELLARLGRVDPKLLKPVTHRTKETQQDLVLIRSRAALVRSRTLLINSVRGQVKSAGCRMRSSSSETFGKRTDELPETLRPALAPVMELIRKLTAEIRDYDKRIEEIAKDDPDTTAVRSVPGVGALTALAFVRTLEDPSRYRNGRAAAAFVGLVPRRSQSGKGDPQLRITKCGDPYLRQLLVGSAHYILGPFGTDCALRRWGLELAARGGKNAKKRAVVALARKLAVVLFHLWQNGEMFDPFPGQKTSADDSSADDSSVDDSSADDSSADSSAGVSSAGR